MDFFSLSGCELVSLAAILSVAIAKEFSSDEIDTLGNFLSSLGINLITIASSQSSDFIATDTSNSASPKVSQTNCTSSTKFAENKTL